MGDLVMVEAFLNTLDERTFSVHGETHVPHDQLSSVQALAAFMAAHDLPSTPLHPSDVSLAVALRGALRKTLIKDDETFRPPLPSAAPTAPTAPPPPPTALASFPLQLAPAPGGGLRLVAATGVPGLDVVLETVATSAADGSWKRLKLCASDDCHWAFYDTSRSGGGRWCDMQVCGNRHKTRAYRRRNA